jgi:flagellar hook-length control protein FliK
MTINSSLGCAGAPASLAPPDPAAVAAPGADAEAAAVCSLFSVMLSGMSEAPLTAPLAAKSPAPAGTDEVEIAPSVDESETLDDSAQAIAATQSIVAAQALVAALTPVVAAPVPATQLKPAPPAESLPVVSPGTARPELPTLDNQALAAAWLVASNPDMGDDEAPKAPLAGDESLEHLAIAAQSASPPSGGTPAGGFSPLMQVSQLSNAVAQTNVLQPQPPLQHSVGTTRWAEELGTRLTMMASQGQLSGSLSLSPEHLGPLHVQIEIKNDVASVWFGSQHADTRAALHDALPRLREMFGASGLVLGDTGVSRDTPRQEAHAAEARRFAAQREDSVLSIPERRAGQISHAGILDTYA